MLLTVSCQSKQDDQRVTFTGVIKTGAELGEVKQHCAEGLYLVADEGYLSGQTTTLLLRIPDDSGQDVLLADLQYVGKQVEVVGKYPAQEVFCEALICQCEDYILVERIEAR
ncbi:MAG TPA: hypothetical protein VI451_15895 [Anaerolineales bacterium]|nr:hypothetical protein [Anaerolineales bacterium]